MKTLLKLTESEAKKVVGGVTIKIPVDKPYTDILISKFGSVGDRGPFMFTSVLVDHPTFCVECAVTDRT